MKLLKQSLVIVLSIASVYAIVHTQLSSYIAQILGLLIIASVIYIVGKKRAKREEELFVGSYIEFFTINVGILLIIFLSEGFHSNLFFLVYFLLFGMTFMFEPPTVFVFMLGLIILFIEQALGGDVFSNLIRLGSLILLTPIAYFFGREFKRREKLEEEIEDKADQIIDKAEKILEKESEKMDEEDVEAIDEIASNAKDLKDEAEKP